MQTTLHKLNTLTKQVEETLKRVPEARNSDLILQSEVLMRYYPRLERPISNWNELVSVMRTVPSLDYIARTRRAVIRRNDYKKYLPTSAAVAEARKYNMQLWKEYSLAEGLESLNGSNYPPNVEDRLKRTGRTEFDD